MSVYRFLMIPAVIGLLFSSCATYNYGHSSKKVKANHEYSLKVVDYSGDPVQKAKIYYKINLDKDDFDDTIVDSVSYTNSNGLANETISFKKSELDVVSTKIKYEVKKDNYRTKYGSEYIVGEDGQEKVIITLLKTSDYFKPNFLTSNKEKPLVKNINSFINAVISKGIQSKSKLEPKSIGFSNFQNKKYLDFEFTSGIVYNSIQVDNYEMGRKLFDKIVRNILSPLNNISAQDQFSGYNVGVRGYKKRSTDEYASPNEVYFNFYLPKKAVKKYKDKKITGQDLLDSSVILMENERIDLELQ